MPDIPGYPPTEVTPKGLSRGAGGNCRCRPSTNGSPFPRKTLGKENNNTTCSRGQVSFDTHTLPETRAGYPAGDPRLSCPLQRLPRPLTSTAVLVSVQVPSAFSVRAPAARRAAVPKVPGPAEGPPVPGGASLRPRGRARSRRLERVAAKGPRRPPGQGPATSWSRGGIAPRFPEGSLLHIPPTPGRNGSASALPPGSDGLPLRRELEGRPLV